MDLRPVDPAILSCRLRHAFKEYSTSYWGPILVPGGGQGTSSFLERFLDRGGDVADHSFFLANETVVIERFAVRVFGPSSLIPKNYNDLRFLQVFDHVLNLPGGVTLQLSCL